MMMADGWTPEDEKEYEEWVDDLRKNELKSREIVWKFGDIKMVYRDEWGAKKPKLIVPITEPISNFRHYYTHTDQCFTKEECSKVLQKLQKNHFKQGLPDVQFNFMIGGDGNVYEGAGWFCKVIDLNHYLLEADGGPRIIIGYIGNEKDVTDEKLLEMQKIGHDLPNWGIDHNLVVGGPLWRPTGRDPSPYDAGWVYNNVM